jgi:hypothetical protein
MDPMAVEAQQAARKSAFENYSVQGKQSEGEKLTAIR